MTRLLKTSGFAGLGVMMLVGLYQNAILAGGDTVPSWMIGGHAHLGVLSILAIVLGFAIPALEVADRLRTAVSAMFVVGQWALPLMVWTAEGFGLEMLHPTAFLWGAAGRRDGNHDLAGRHVPRGRPGRRRRRRGNGAGGRLTVPADD